MVRTTLSSLLLASLAAITPIALVACASVEGDEATEADESNLTEGSAEARGVLALVNDRSVTADELVREARTPAAASRAIVEHRDGADGRAGTADDDPFDTLRELDAVPGVGAATIGKLLDYARRKGLVGGGSGGNTGNAVIFSPAPSMEASHLARVAQTIDGARRSIDIAMYSYSDAKISEALGRAVDRGVKVRFLFNDGGADNRITDAAAKASSKSGKLEAIGANVRFVNKTMHHKLMIVDGPRDQLSHATGAKLVSGSGNWSNGAAMRYDENTLFLENQPELTLRFQREFDLMWAHSRDFVGASALPYELSTTTIDDATIPDSAATDVLFTSDNFSVRDTTFSTTGENTVADALVAAIQGATQSIHVASGHLRSRPVAEALIAKKAASPDVDIRVYLDGQEYIARGTHEIQIDELDECLAAATTESKRRECLDKGFLFGYQVGEAGIDVRYKYYAYRWDNSYALQMHHKYMVIDHATLYTGSYNLSDNAEHETFENMMVFRGAESASLVQSFEQRFESMWKTGRDEGKLATLQSRIDQPGSFPIVFDSMALTWSEVTGLKQKIRAACPAVDSQAYRISPASHQVCSR